MTVPEIKNIKIKVEDIFAYVTNMSQYDPIEKCIDTEIYEVFDEFIYNRYTRETLVQDEDFINFSKQVSLLRSKASKMSNKETSLVCGELQEIAPTYVKL